MTVELVQAPARVEVQSVARRMRAADFEEISATSWHRTREDVAAELAHKIDGRNGFTWSARWNGTPTAIIGAIPMHPTLWSVFAFGTDDWPRVVLSLTRHVRHFMIPGLMHAGCHRAICASHAHHRSAHRWLEMLGASKESVQTGAGKDGQDFFLYVWRRPAHVHCA